MNNSGQIKASIFGVSNDSFHVISLTAMPKKIKVLLVLPNLFIGGVEKVLVLQCSTLQKSGRFDIRVLATKNNGPIYQQLRALGVDVALPTCSTADPNFLARREILLFNPDIVYVTNTNIVQALGNLGQKYPTLITVYHMRGAKQWCIDEVLEYSNSGYLDHLIVTYEDMYALVEHGVSKQNVTVMGNPLKNVFFEKAPSVANVICYSGRLDRGKCLGSFVRILHEVKKTIPDTSGLIIGDEDGLPWNQGVRSMITSLSKSLDVPIEITGFVDNVEDYLGKAKVFLLTSGTEGFCNSIWEAIAVGLIPVSTRVGSLTKELAERNDSYLSDINHQEKWEPDFLPEDVEKDLSKKCIVALRSNPNVQQIKKIATPFHVDAWASKFVNLMLNMVNGGHLPDGRNSQPVIS